MFNGLAATVIDKKTHSASTVPDGNPTLLAPAVVKIILPRAEIKAIAREGDDLAITTVSGERFVITDFFTGTNGVANSLVLQEADGSLWLSSAGQAGGESGSFTHLETLESLLYSDNSGLGGLPLILSAVGLGAAAVAGSSSGSGGGSPPPPPENVTVSITALSPDTGLSSSDLITNASHVILYGTVTGILSSGSKVQFSLDGGQTWHDAQHAGGNLYQYDNRANTLADGTYTIQIRVIGPDGHTEASATRPIVIDTTPPASVIQITGIIDDSGISNTDFITHDNTLIFNGTLNTPLEAGEQVQISLDGGLTWKTATVTGTAWAYNNTATVLPDGTYSVLARVIDTAGNSGSTASQAVQIDTQAPAVILSITAISTDTGSSNSDFITSDNTLIFMGTLTGTLGADEWVEISLDGGNTWHAVTRSGSSWSYDNTANSLAPATYDIQLRAVDIAGNAGKTVHQTVVVTNSEIGPPATGISITAIITDTGISNSDFITSDNTLIFHGTLTAALNTDQRVEISLDGGATWTTAPASGTTWTFDNTAHILADGVYDVRVHIIGSGGSIGQTARQLVTVDTVPPASIIAISAITTDTGSSSSDFITSDNTLIFSGTLNTPLEAGEQVQISLDGGLTWKTATVTGTAWTYNNTATVLPDGTYSVLARVIDTAGNSGSIASQAVQIVTQASAASLSITAITTDTGISSSDFITSTNTLIFMGTLAGTLSAGEWVEISLDGGNTWHAATLSGSNWSYDNTANILPSNTYDIQLRTADIAGNTGTAIHQTVVVNTNVPAAGISITAITTDTGSSSTDFISSDKTLVFHGTLTTPLSADQRVEISLDGGTTWVTATVSGTVWIYDNTTSILTDGVYDVRAHVIDSAGNIGQTARQQVTVDTAPPVSSLTIDAISTDTGISSSDFITGDNTLTFNGSLGAALNPEESVEISLDGGLTWKTAEVSGMTWTYANTSNTLLDGSYSILARVIDKAGNIGNTTSQTVVVDTLAPSSSISITGITQDTGISNSDFITRDNTLTFTGSLGTALNTGEWVEISLDGGLTWNTAAVSGTTWSYDNTATILTDGAYDIHVRIIDTAGNIGNSATQTVVIETATPVAVINITSIVNDTNINNDFITRDDTLFFNGTLSTTLNAGQRVEISLDGGLTWNTATVSGMSWTYDNTANILPDGSYTIVARVIDIAGNIGSTSTQNVVINTVAPAPSINITSITDDTGSSSSDFITSDNTLIINGTLSLALNADQWVEISLDGGLTWNTATVSGTSWTYDNTTNILPDGTYNVVARIVDLAGNIGKNTLQAVVVDTAAPSASIFINTITSDTGSSSTDFITSDNTLIFNGSLSAPLGSGERVEISLDGGTTWFSAVTSGTAWSYDNTVNILTDGTYTVIIRTIDTAGNIGNSATQSVVIDNVAPAAAISITSIINDSGNPTDFITNDSSLIFNGTLNAALGAGESVEISLDGGLTWHTATVSGATWSYDNTGNALPDGTYTISARVVDIAGNIGNSTSQTVILDTAAPTAAITIAAISTDTGSSGTDFITSDNTLIFNGNLGANLRPGERVEISLDGGLTWSTASVSGRTWNYDNTVSTLPDGIYSVQARIIDTAGNIGNIATQTVVVDTLPPTATISITSIINDSGNPTDFITNDNTLIFNGALSTPLDAGESVEISLDGGISWNAATVSGTAWSYDNTSNFLADGTYTVLARIIDTAGNTSSTASQSVEVDTSAPNSIGITIASIITDTGSSNTDFITSNNTLIFNGNLSSPLNPGDRVEISLDGGLTWSIVTVSGTTWTYDNSANVLVDGTYNVQVHVIDTADTVGQTSSRVLVIDTIPPSPAATITIDSILSDSAISNDFITNDSTLIFNGSLGAPLAAGERVEISLDGGLTWNTAFLSGTTWRYDNTGSILPDGTYAVVARTIDIAGNIGSTATQSVVVDTQAPSASIHITGITTDTGSSGTDFITSDNTLIFSGSLGVALDAGENVQISLDGGISWANATVTGTTWRYDNTATPLTDGTYTVIVRTIDIAGNIGETATQPVVVDTQAPTASISISSITTDTGSSSSDFITSDSSLTFSGTLSAPLGSGDRIDISLDGGVTWYTATVSGTTWSYDNTATILPDGIYDIRTRVIDTAGNIGNSAAQTVVVDTQAPTAIVSITSITNDTGISSSDFITSDNTLVFNGALSTALRSGERVDISLDGGASWITATTLGTTWLYDHTASMLSDGIYSVVVRVIDTTGNIGSTANQSVVVDTAAPLSSISITSLTSDSGNPTDFITNDNTLIFNGALGTPLDPDERVDISLDGGITWHTASVTGTVWNYDNTANTLADGTYTVRVRVIDTAGNAGNTASQSIVVDTRAPTAGISITGITNDTGTSNSDFITSDDTLIFSGSISAALGAGERVEISLDGGITWNTATVSGTAWSYNNTGSILPDGTYSVTARTIDTAGNIGNTATQLVVVDTQDPTAGIYIAGINTDTGSSGSDFITSDNTLIFNGTLSAPLGSGERVDISLDGGITWHTATASGTGWSYDNTATTLTDGTYTVRARVIDTAGNIGSTASQSVIVDTRAPTASISISAIITDTGSSNTDFITSDNTLIFTGSLSAALGPGERVDISLDGGVTWNMAAVSSTGWIYDNTANPLTDGTYTLRVRVIDTAGNIGSTASQSVVIDTAAPAPTVAITSITTDTGSSSTDFITSDNTLIFNGTLSAPLGSGERVDISLDGGTTWVTTTVSGTAWSYNNTARPLADGSYSLVARVIDTAGNLGSTVSQVVVVDTQPPIASIRITSITTDTGSSSTDFITSNNTLVFNGNLSNALGTGESVQISLNGGTTWVTATVTGTNWSYDNSANTLADGTYSVRVRVIDTAGNIGSTATQSVVVDTRAPTAAISITSITTDTGSSSTDFITSDNTLIFNGTLSTALGAGESVQISLDGGTTWITATVTGTTWTYNNTATALPDGTYQVLARVIDIAGNIGNSDIQTVVIDTSTPTASISITSISTDTGSSSSDFITSDNTLIFNGTLGTPLESGQRVEISLDGGVTWHTATVSGTTWTYDNTATILPDGTYGVRARVNDTAGNIGSTVNQSVVVDTLAPTPTVAITSISTDTGSSSSDFVTSDNTLIFNGTLSAPLGSGERVEISLDGGTTWVTATVAGIGWTYNNAASVLTDGTYNVRVRVIDTAGNIGSTAAQSVVVDTVTPTSIISITSITTDTGSSSSDFITSDQTLIFNGTLSAALGAGENVQISLNGGATWVNATTSGTSWTYDNTATSLANNTYNVQVRVIDTAGNIGSTASQSVVVDTVAPTATVTLTSITTDTGSSSSDFITSDNTLIFNGTLSAPLGSGERVEISLNGGTTWVTTTVTGTSWIYDNSTNTLTDGTYSARIRVIDTAGNVGSTASQSVVVDTAAPTPTIAITSITTDSGSSSSDFISNDNTLIFNGTLSASLGSGERVEISLNGGTTWVTASVTGTSWAYNNTASVLPDGTYSIRVRTIDTAGNIGSTASQSVVVDTVAPTATVTLTSITTDTGSSSSDFITSDNTLIFNGTLSAPLGSGERVEISLNGGTTWVTASVTGTSWNYDNTANTLASGTYSVRIRVIDTAGNVGSTASQSVVVDTAAPTPTIAITRITTDSGSSSSDFITSDNTLIFNGTLSASLGSGERVEISLDGGTTWVTASVTGTSWTYNNTASVLPDGTYSIRVRTIDTAGNIGNTASRTVVVDTTPPAPTIAITSITTDTGNSSSDFITNDNTLIFNGTLSASLGSGERVEISLNGGTTWVTATVTGTSWTYNNTANILPDGTYSIRVRTIDTAGNIGSTANQSVVVDTLAPAPSVAITSISTDTGSSSSDFITNDNTLIFNGTLSAPLGSGERVEISLDGGTTWVTATATGTNWNYDNTATTLADSTYNVRVRVIDTAGNIGSTASRSVVVDTTPPVPNVAITSITTDSGSSSSDFITNDNTLIFNGTLSAPLGSGERIEISLNGGTTWVTATVTGTSWTYNNTANILPDGTYSIRVRAIDTAGNIGNTASQSVVVDTVAPAPNIAITSITTDTGSSSSDFITSDNTLILNGTLSAPLGAGESVQVSANNGLTWVTATVSGTSWSYDNSANIAPDGIYSIRARTIDIAGNIGKSTTQSIIIDTVAPTSTINIAAIISDTGISNADFITNDNTLVFTGNLGSTLGIREYVEISLDGGLTWKTASVSGKIWTYNNTANSLSDGTYNVIVRVIDTAGNIGHSAVQTVVVDTLPPTATVTIAGIDTDTGSSSTDFITRDNTLIFNGTLSAPLGSGERVDISLDGGTTWVSTTVTGTNWSYDNTANPLSDGTYSVRVRVIDTAGNIGNTASQSVVIDTAAPDPTISIISINTDTGLSSGDFITSDNTLIFNGTLSANLGSGERVEISLDGGATWNIALVTGTSWSYDNTATTLIDGAYSITVRTIDTAGNIGSTASHTVVIDTIAPTAAVTISSIDTDTGNSNTDFITNDQTLIFSGSIDTALGPNEWVQISLDGGATWITTTVSGTTWTYNNTANILPEGHYTVMARVIDTAGNIGNTATQSVVIDHTAPSTTIAITSIDTDTGSSSSDFITRDNTLIVSGILSAPLAAGERVEIGLDGIPPWITVTVTGTVWSFNYTAVTLPDGTYNVHVRVIDAAGNIGNIATQTVIVDTIAPSAIISIVSITDDTGTDTSDFITSDNTLIFNGALSTALQPDEFVQISLDGGVNWLTATVNGASWSYDNTGNILADNTYVIQARVIDIAGNIGSTTSQSVQVDTTTPAAIVSITSITTDTGNSSSDFITSDNALIFKGELSTALLAGEQVEISLDGGVTWNIATVSGTSWSYDNTANILADDTYTLLARVIDYVGNIGNTATQSIVIDTTPPNNSIVISFITDDTGVNNTDFITSDNALIFSGVIGGVLAPGEGVEISLDGGSTWYTATVSGTTWSYDNTTTLLPDNTYNVLARVIDTAGNIGQIASQTVIVDTTPPTANISITSIIDDSGVLNDFITTDSTLIFNGSLSTPLGPNEWVEISLDGGVSWARVSVSGTSWSYDNTHNILPYNTYTVQARVLDIAGNIGSVATQVVQIIPGDIAVTINSITTNAGITSNFITNDNTLSFNGQISTALLPGYRVEISLDGGSTWHVTTVAGTNWTYNNTASTLPDGTYTIQTRVVDNLNNVGQTASQSLTVDTTAPLPAIAITSVNSDTGPSNTDFITSDGTLVFNGTLSAPLVSGDRVQISLDGGLTWHIASVSGTTWSYDNTYSILPDNTYNVHARVVDIAGNIGQSTNQIVIVDTVAPTADIHITSITTDTGISNADFITSDNTLIFNGTLSAALGTNEYVQISLDGITWHTASVTGTTWSYDNTANILPDNIYGVYARVIDAAGNVGQTTVQNIQVDTIPPAANTIAITAIATDTGVPTDFITSDSTLVFSGTLGNGLKVDERVEISLNGGLTWHLATVSGSSWTYNNTASILPDGVYDVRARVVDLAGNIGNTTSQAVVIDTVVPTATIAITSITTDTGSSNSDFITSDNTLVFNGTLSTPLGAGERVDISLDGGVTWLTATVTGAIWRYDNTADILPDGTYNIRARVVDTAGNIGGTANQVVVIQSAPPATSITITSINTDTGISSSDFITRDNTLIFNGKIGTALNASERIQISLDGGITWHTASVTGTSWTYDNTASILPDGTYTLIARVVNIAGNIGQSATQSVVIDTVPPSAAIAITSINTDTGSSNTDFITNDNTLIFRGTLSAPLGSGERVEISLDNGLTWSTSTVSGATWSYNNTARALTDGTYTVRARVIDTAGNIGNTTSQNVIVDTATPTATVAITSISTDTGISSTDFITGDNTLIFNGTLSAALGAGENVQISLNGGTSWVIATVSGTSWSSDNSANTLTDGTYTVRVRVVDTAGNIGSTANQVVVVDTQAPAASISITAISTDSNIDNDFITNDNTLSFNGSLSQPLGSGEYVQISLNGGLTWATATVSGSVWIYDNSANILPDGTYNVIARVIDAAGNIGSTTHQTVIVDTAPPSAIVAITSINADTGLSSSDFITSDNTLIFNGTLSTALGIGESVQISLDGGLTWNTATVTGNSWIYDNTGTVLVDNTYTLQARVTDAAGNIGNTTSQTIIIDTVPPSAATTVSITSITTDTGSNNTDFITSNNTLIFNGKIGSALGTDEQIEISLDGGLTWNTAAVTGTTWSYDNTASTLPDGTYSVRARVIDTAGNIGQTTSQTVVIDTIAPAAGITIASISTDTGSSSTDFITSDNTLIFNGTLGAALGAGEGVQISLDGGLTWNTATVAGTAWTYNNSTATLPDGTYTVRARVIDTAGNVGQTASQAVVVDTVAPSAIIAITSINTDTGSSSSDFITGDNTLVFNGSLSTALGAGESVDISLDGGLTWVAAAVTGTTWRYDNSAAILTDGTYTVRARVIDTAGNIGSTTVQTVVIDTLPPTPGISITGISTDTGDSGSDFITSDTTLIFNGALSAVLGTGESVQISLDGGLTWKTASVTGTSWTYNNTLNTLTDGNYTVIVRTIDTAGNIGNTATQIVTVDTVAPTTGISITSINTDTGLSSSDFITSDNTLIFNGALSATLGINEYVQVSLDGGLTWKTASVSGTSWSYDNTANTLTDGNYTVRARVVDRAGNIGNTTTQIVVVDTVAPTPNISITSITTDTGSSSTDFITSDNTLIFNGALSATLGTGERVEISLDGGSTWATATVAGTSWTYNNTANTLPDATYTVITRVIDIAGNIGKTATKIIVVDTIAPSISISITSINTDTGLSSSDFITGDNTLIFNGSLSAALGADESVQISLDGGTTWLTATVTGTNWHYDNTANVLPDGTYTVLARVIDTAGNIGTTTTQTVVIDTVASSASIAITRITDDTGSSSTDFITNDNTLIFNGSLGAALGASEHVQISLDGGLTWNLATVIGTSWIYDNSANILPDGTYSVIARVIDTAGNIGNTATQAVVVNTAAPTATISITSIATDTGSSSTDFITSDDTLIFNGALSAALGADESVQISLDGGTTWLTATVTGTSWLYDNNAIVLPDGTYSVVARVVNIANSVGSTATQTVVVDTMAPTVSISITSITDDTGSSTDFITSDNTLIFNGTLSAALGAGENVQISLDGGTTWLTATVTGTSWSYDNTASVLTDNTYSVVARVIDTAGNIGNTTTQTVVVDTTAPTASISITSITDDTGSSNSDFITSDNTLIFNGALSAALGADESVQISLDGGTTWLTATVTGTSWLYDNTANVLPDDTYSVVARVIDTAGNIGNTTTQTVVIDTTVPTAAISITSITDDTGTSNSDFITSDNTLIFNGALSAALGADESVQISLDGGTTWLTATVTGTSWLYDNTANVLSDGTYSVITRVINIANSVGSTATQTVVVDTMAPTASISISITDDTGASSTDLITSDDTLIFNGTLSTALGAGERVQISIDGGATWLTATVTGTSWLYDNTANVLPDDTYSVIARVIDTAGNIGNTTTQTVVIDTTVPTAAISITSITDDTGSSNSDFITSDNTLIFNGTLSATLGTGERVEISLDGGTTWITATVTGTNWLYDNTASVLPDDTYSVVARVIDTAGNIGNTTSQSVVINTLTPVLAPAFFMSDFTFDAGSSSPDSLVYKLLLGADAMFVTETKNHGPLPDTSPLTLQNLFTSHSNDKHLFADTAQTGQNDNQNFSSAPMHIDTYSPGALTPLNNGSNDLISLLANHPLTLI